MFRGNRVIFERCQEKQENAIQRYASRPQPASRDWHPVRHRPQDAEAGALDAAVFAKWRTPPLAAGGRDPLITFYKMKLGFSSSPPFPLGHPAPAFVFADHPHHLYPDRPYRCAPGNHIDRGTLRFVGRAGRLARMRWSATEGIGSLPPQCGTFFDAFRRTRPCHIRPTGPGSSQRPASFGMAIGGRHQTVSL